VEENVSNYNCYLDEKEWLRITSELNSSRLFARIINGDKSWICALGNPIRTGNPESFKQLFVPQWMLHQIHDDGVGEPLEVEWMSSDLFDNSRHIVLEPFTDISEIENIDEVLQNQLTLLGILQKGTLIYIDYNDSILLFLVKDLMPASVVLCEGDEVSLEFYKDPPPPERVSTPIPVVDEPPPLVRFNPWRNKDFKPNLS
jgi:hypothetical protein